MKKLVFLTVVFLMTTTIQAQEGYDNTKHEVALSYGFISNSQWLDVFENVIGAVFGEDYDNEKFVGPFSAEYFYHFKNWIGVGGVLVYGHNSQDVMDGTDKKGDISHNYFSIMPAVKFDWLRKNHWGLYSKIALGATFRSEKKDYIDPSAEDLDDSDVHFNWQATLIGVEAGSPTIRGFAELGCGEQGIMLLGVRYKF